MKIALVSFDIKWEDKEENLAICAMHIKDAIQENVDLIIFPEMTLTGFSNNVTKIAEDVSHSQSIEKFSMLAKEYKIAIIFGLSIEDDKKALNQSVFLDKDGDVIGRYSKIHPFSFANEEYYYNSGNKLSVIKFKNLRIGLTICYDLRFPEIYSGLAKDADLIVNIANWPQKRIDHWDTLLKARAIENQVFIIGVNRVGCDGNGLSYNESNVIYNANGEKVNNDTLNSLKIYEIDVGWTNDFRKGFNTVKDRKTEFYKGIL